MQLITLQPTQIIVPGERHLWSDDLLKVYFRMFDKGHGEDLPPVIVAKNNLVSSDGRNARLEDVVEKLSSWGSSRGRQEYTALQITEITQAYAKFEEIIGRSPFYLIDGNHRSVAATLTSSPIYALELESNRDIAEIKRMVIRGELFNFERPENALMGIVLAFEKHILGNDMGNDMHIEECMTVKETVDKLASSQILPQYMKDRYQIV